MQYIFFAILVLKLPKGLYRDMMNTIADFWRGDDGDEKRMHW